MNGILRRFLTPALLSFGVISVLSLPLYATDEEILLRDWHHAVTRDLRHATGIEKRKRIERAVQATADLLNFRRVEFKVISLGKAGNPAFLFSTRASASPLNRVAAEVARKLPGVGLVYSPADLMRGSAAFFSESDFVLGVSHASVEYGEKDEAFFHEVIHASHAVARRAEVLDPFSAVISLREKTPGLGVSPSRNGYMRHQTFEEIEAYVESLSVLSEDLRNLARSPGKAEEIQSLLGIIHFTAEEGAAISEQSADVAARALKAEAWQTDSDWMEIGMAGNRTEWQRSIFLDAYESGTSGRWIAHPRAAELSWKLSTPRGSAPVATAEDLRSGLESAADIAERTRKEFASVESSIYWVIERADVSKTDLSSVAAAIEGLERTFHAWKSRHSRTGIARF